MKDEKKKLNPGLLAFATMLGTGYSPFAPGTAGSAAALIIYWLFLSRLAWPWFLALWLALFIPACLAAEAVRKNLGQEDPQIVVIDEALGYFAAMFLLPPAWTYMLGAFFLFRALDIWKPFPASYFDKKVQNGFGIVMDDVVAGIYANLALQLIRLMLSA